MTTNRPSSKILVVDDEVPASKAVRMYLEKKGYTVEIANDGLQALSKVEEFNPDCILLDMRMPRLNGLEALGKIKLRHPTTAIIMTTAVDNLRMAEECLRKGAFGYIPKPLDMAYLVKQIECALNKRSAHVDRKSWDEIEQLLKEGEETDLGTLLMTDEVFNALKLSIDVIHFSDPDFALHSKNTAWLAREIGEELKFSYLLRTIEVAGLFHDIGKQSFPPMVRNIPFDNLPPAEKKIFLRFPLHGQHILPSYGPLEGVGIIIKHQCENVDGTGFPIGLTGKTIPMPSKIIAVANAFDEMLGENNRRNIEIDIRGWNCDKPLNEIKMGIGEKFDPVVVDALVKVVNRYKSNPRKEKLVQINQLRDQMVLSREIETRNGKIIFLRNTVLSGSKISIIYDYDKIDPLAPILVYSKD